ncbi:HET-domain-containing protein [Polyplosphaeria fusca]|uniref:HET-domain-containing protein n=1 Tax=Polyplosphaeria fusca TaxID=682080 RepID=A0A9P4QKW1_9PLEO|nr:HET-domain-containing protein [Polyplosphaeria fusca]
MRSLKYASVWVDAICINQTDINERSSQVLRMQGIYAGAQATLVALDIEDAPTKDLLQVLSIMNPDVSPENQDSRFARSISTRNIQSAMTRLCEEQYWKRIWILQEFAVGHRVDILLGKTVVDIRCVEMLLTDKSSSGIRGRAQVDSVFDIRQAWLRKGTTREHHDALGDPLSMLDILRVTRDSVCARNHDRVFGLLGLIPDALEFLSEPKYENSIYEMSVSMTRSYIERHSLDIIILAQHHQMSDHLPTWSPDFFGLNQFPNSNRVWAQAIRSHNQGTNIRNWSATGDSSSACTFDRGTMSTTARRIGTIQSLGRAWSDSHSDAGEFPCHNDEWARNTTNVKIEKMIYEAMLERDYAYNPKQNWLKVALKLSHSVYKAYCWLQIFSPKHGSIDPEETGNELERWICANRNFYAGGKSLQDHARDQGSIYFRCGLSQWIHPAYSLFDPKYSHGIYQALVWTAEEDMRMMCLDKDCFGIGWAAKGARLDDEVFLVPGCRVPLILRRAERSGQYRLVGDAIVIGAMRNEVWSKNRPEDIVRVDII